MAFPVVIAVLLAVGATACASRQLHVRGEIDRRHWILRTCDTQESYRVMMTSNQAGDFILRERKNNLSTDEPLVLEFDAFTISPKFFWESQETIGPASKVKIARGTCAAPGTPVP